ncbi:hypothetical protein VTK73DRAFT_1357 [Phialemonium thermophilum]|uniref:Uncharacterized protein n=1 Tax=Phialemonium thermophilum TaxID=223376 RepID=A0ABR3VTJ1_9PEZI
MYADGEPVGGVLAGCTVPMACTSGCDGLVETIIAFLIYSSRCQLPICYAWEYTSVGGLISDRRLGFDGQHMAGRYVGDVDDRQHCGPLAMRVRRTQGSISIWDSGADDWAGSFSVFFPFPFFTENRLWLRP